MIETEESRILFERIRKGESLKAISLIDSLTEKFAVKPYADAYAAVLIADVLKRLNLEINRFYADENEFINMLFAGDSARDARRNVICALCEKADSVRKINYDDALKKAENYIHECYCDFQLCEDVLCDLTGLSRSTFSQLFKKKYGVGPGEYISRYRLEKSIELLEKSDITLDEIAEMTGFYGTETYSRVFKRFYHITPGKYRIAARKNI